MKKKENRLELIRHILETREVHSQEELMELLSSKGLVVTQATLSRDFKALKVMKIAVEGGRYIYTLPEMLNSIEEEPRNSFPINGFKSIQFSLNTAVIKTLPGYAAGIASVIDTENYDEILGTIAGDDTILLIMGEHVSSTRAKRVLKKIIPQI